MSRSVAVIGAGPAGLMAAEVISAAGHAVTVFEHKPSAARKFLMAGKGGLNISHSEPLAEFIQRYDAPDWLGPLLQAFGPAQVVDWMAGLGLPHTVGSSGRIFPADFRAAPLLRRWLQRLQAQGVQFQYRTRWLGWCADGQRFAHEGQVWTRRFDAVVLAVGGGSWARLGSDGQALDWLAAQGIGLQPLAASNAGFVVQPWSPQAQALAGQPLKTLRGWVAGQPEQVRRGDLVLTTAGIEGGLVYALSRPLRTQLQQSGAAVLVLDVWPDRSEAQLTRLLQRGSAGDSLGNRWRKAGLTPVQMTLLREVLPRADWADPQRVAATLKALPLRLTALQPMDEAISTAGGIRRQALDRQLMLMQQPGVFCCGEMLDWDAPTGGYLLTACLSSGHWAGQGVKAFLDTTPLEPC